ncbi:hypothetical protein [Crossiella sp. NPDC003009]
MADPVPLVGRGPQVAALRQAVAAPPVVLRLEGEARAGPAVLVLDDLHWADEQTVEFLRFLTGHLPERLALVVAYRPGEVDPEVRAALGPGTTVRLEPLTDRQTAAMALAMLGCGRVPAQAREALQRRTGGVPFAIEEVVRDAAERGDAPWAELAGERVPANFREAIEQRLARVAAEVRAVIGAAAAFGFLVPALDTGVQHADGDGAAARVGRPGLVRPHLLHVPLDRFGRPADRRAQLRFEVLPRRAATGGHVRVAGLADLPHAADRTQFRDEVGALGVRDHDADRRVRVLHPPAVGHHRLGDPRCHPAR